MEQAKRLKDVTAGKLLSPGPTGSPSAIPQVFRSTDALKTPLRGSEGEFFWEGLPEAGNRGRVVWLGQFPRPAADAHEFRIAENPHPRTC